MSAAQDRHQAEGYGRLSGKDAKMARQNRRVVHALFESIGDNGVTWQFIIHADDKWSITRNGKPVDVGPADRMGIGGGVRQYIRLSGKVERDSSGRRVRKSAAGHLAKREVKESESCAS
jgi:hypothetical protein